MNKKVLQQHRSHGAAVLIFILLFLAASTILAAGVSRGVFQDIIRYRNLQYGKQSYFGAEALIDDALHRFRNDMVYLGPTSLTMGDVTVTATSSVIVDYFTIEATAENHDAYRTNYLELALGNGASFAFGLQAGNGGITMSNNSSVVGNVFSNLHVTGQGSATIYGDVVAAGPAGIIESIYATGTAYAHSIDDSVIDGDAYVYAPGTITATIVGGNTYTGIADQATSALPISDELIQSWKDYITASGTVIASTDPECSGGTWVIDTDAVLKDVKIECNVDLEKKGSNTVLTLEGPIWIEGNFNLKAGPEIRASSSIGARSVQIVVDNESDRVTSSKISVNQATNFYGSGNPKSYVLLLSMNNDAENGGTEDAITLAQSLNGDVLVYASHGLVSLGNNITLKEVTAFQIDVNNGADVIYETGLISTLFSGPSAGFDVSDWREI